MKLLVRLILALAVLAIGTVWPVSVVPVKASTCTQLDTYAQTICADNPYYFFRFQASGNTADVVGNTTMHETYLSGTSFVSTGGPGVSGSGNAGYAYSGTSGGTVVSEDSGGSANNVPVPRVAGAFTVEAWVYEESTYWGVGPGPCAGSPSNGVDGQLTNTSASWGLNNGELSWIVWDCSRSISKSGLPDISYQDSTGGLQSVPFTSFTRNTWHLVDQVFSGATAPTMSVYLDGSLYGTKTFSGNVVANNNVWEFFGNFNNAGGQYSSRGLRVTDAAYYETALTSSQVLSHYNAMGTSTLPGAGNVTIEGHTCVRALALDNGSSSCANGDIAVSRSVIGFSTLSTVDASTIVCGRSACATSDSAGEYIYTTNPPTGTTLYWIFQGNGWCAGCAGQFKYRPASGYNLANITAGGTTTGNDFVIDAQLYRNSDKVSPTLNTGVIGFVTTGASGALSNLGVTLTPAQEATLQAADNAFSSAASVAAEDVNTGFGRLIGGVGGAVVPLTIITTLVMNPSETAPAELWFPDTGTRINLAPLTTTTITVNPTTEPHGVTTSTGQAIAIDTVITGANPTPGVFGTPVISGTPVPAPTPTASNPTTVGNTTCGLNLFQLWDGLGPLIECLFIPTQPFTNVFQVTDPVTGTSEDIPTALKTKVGFSDFYQLENFICAHPTDPTDPNQVCNISGGLFSWFQGGTCWTGFIPWYDPHTSTVSTTDLTWNICSTDPTVIILRQIVTLGIMIFAIGGIGSAILAFFGVGSNEIEPLTEEQGSAFGEDSEDAPNHTWPEG